MRIILIEKHGATIIHNDKDITCDRVVDHEESEDLYIFVSHKKKLEGYE